MPLVTMIFGFGVLAKVVLAWLIVFFIVFFNTFQGARGVDPDLIHSARFLGASERQVMLIGGESGGASATSSSPRSGTSTPPT